MRLVDGRFTCRLPPPPPAPPTVIPASSRGAPVIPSAAAVPAAPAWDLSQQMAQLAILMLMDLGTLKGGLYKGEILAAGGVVVLTARLADKGSHDQVRGQPLYKWEILAAGGVGIRAPSLSARNDHRCASGLPSFPPLPLQSPFWLNPYPTHFPSPSLLSILKVCIAAAATLMHPHSLHIFSPPLPSPCRFVWLLPQPWLGSWRMAPSQWRRPGVMCWWEQGRWGCAYRDGQPHCVLAGGSRVANPPGPEVVGRG